MGASTLALAKQARELCFRVAGLTKLALLLRLLVLASFFSHHGCGSPALATNELFDALKRFAALVALPLEQTPS